MIQVLFPLPVVVILVLGGALLGGAITPGLERVRWAGWAGAAAGAVFFLLIGWWRGWLDVSVPVRGYGTMILLGFLFGVWLARRRAHLLGVPPEACLDVGLLGAIFGIIGSRAFHVILFWDLYRDKDFFEVFRVWHGGLVFYGAFAAAIPVTALYCWRKKIAIVSFLDLAAPSLVAGQALGRLGCFTRGCCFGKTCSLPWAVQFPEGSDAFSGYQSALPLGAVFTPSIHPTQLYAFVGTALVAGFLYAYWPRRRFDGQILGLMLIMVGATRFVEELFRADVGPGFPSLSNWLTIAQWLGMALIVLGSVWLLYFGTRRKVPSPAAGA